MRQTTKETAVITPTARVTAARLAIREARPRRRTSILLWAGQIPLAAFFMFVAAVPHLAGSQQAVQEFGLIGAGQWLRYLSRSSRTGRDDRSAYSLARRSGGRRARRRHGRRDHHQRHGAAQHLIRGHGLGDLGAVRRVRAPGLRPAAADQGRVGSHPPVTGGRPRHRSCPSFGADDDEPHPTRDTGPGRHRGRPGRC